MTGLASGSASAPLAVMVACLAGLTVALITRPVLRRLPEPAEPDGKTAYRDLPTRAFVLACSAAAALTGALAAAALPASMLPPWLVLATIGVLLAGVDLMTTWLPRRLTHAAWMLMVLAFGVCLLAGVDAAVAVRAAVGALTGGGVYGIVWAISRGGVGFGDVRFAPLIGAAAGGVSLTVLVWSLLLGSLLGAAHGLVRLARRRAGPFPYAPAMLAGAYLALSLAPPG